MVAATNSNAAAEAYAGTLCAKGASTRQIRKSRNTPATTKAAGPVLPPLSTLAALLM